MGAQQALRRIMEEYSHTTRFALGALIDRLRLLILIAEYDLMTQIEVLVLFFRVGVFSLCSVQLFEQDHRGDPESVCHPALHATERGRAADAHETDCRRRDGMHGGKGRN